jgi:drug/metabolite transporter (DMT)-like permease
LGGELLSWAVFFAALASACLHASWNVIAKKQQIPSEAVLGIILATAAVCLVAIPFIGLPPVSAWPWLFAAAAFNVIYSRALMTAYDRTALNLAYSVVRAMLPPILFILGFLFFSETIAISAVFGLTLIAASLVLFSIHGWSQRSSDAQGFVLAALAGLVLAFSYACDIKGARISGGHPFVILQYGAASSLVTATGLLGLSLVEKKQPITILRRNWQACASGAALLMASYFLALWAYAQGPVGLVAPVRETSILFGGVFAFLILHERIGSKQWAAIGIAALGAILIKIK